jgi:RNA polymerase sigma-70 factor (ECF subfamily)
MLGLMQKPTPRQREPLATSPAEWSELMVRSQKGDTAAYRLLLVCITPYLRAIAMRAHRNPSDAEDTVQDILLTLHSIRETYDGTRPFKPWLAGIAQHRVADRLRIQGRAANREVALDLDHETFAAPETNMEEAALDHRALRAGLEALPPSQRQAVTLLKLREMSLKEAATVSGMSIVSLKVATHRGIKALRRLLEQPDGEK